MFASSNKGPALRVLVVDDDRDNADTLAVMIRIWGHQVRIAHTGQSALAALLAERPDVAFLDVAMPGMTGLELAAKIRQHCGAATPLLVAVSGYADREKEVEALKAGAHLFLAKPAEPKTIEKLLERVQSLMVQG